MKILFFMLQQLIAIPTAAIISLFLSPFPKIQIKWLKFSLPVAISFANEYLGYLEEFGLTDHERYFSTQYARDNFISQLHRINSMNE